MQYVTATLVRQVGNSMAVRAATVSPSAANDKSDPGSLYGGLTAARSPAIYGTTVTMDGTGKAATTSRLTNRLLE